MAPPTEVKAPGMVPDELKQEPRSKGIVTARKKKPKELAVITECKFLRLLLPRCDNALRARLLLQLVGHCHSAEEEAEGTCRYHRVLHGLRGITRLRGVLPGGNGKFL